jgi:hypothetical protein
MIAFSVADTVRAEVERGIAQQESLRAYYLARGAVEQTLFRIRQAPSFGTSSEEFLQLNRRLHLNYASGDVLVEIVSEQGKLSLRGIKPQVLSQLLAVMGESPIQSEAIVAAITRTGLLPNAALANPNLLSGQNLGPTSTFSPNPASMEYVEELMLIPGVSSEMMYGRFRRLPNGRLVQVGGLADCVSPFAQPSLSLDIWSVHPTLLTALGMDSTHAYALAEARALPYPEARLALAEFLKTEATATPPIALTAGPVGSTFQIRATARVREATGLLSETRRSVALLVNYNPPPPQFFWRDGFSYLRWYDQAYSDVAAMQAPWLTLAPALETTMSGARP